MVGLRQVKNGRQCEQGGPMVHGWLQDSFSLRQNLNLSATFLRRDSVEVSRAGSSIVASLKRHESGVRFIRRRS